MSRPDDAVPWSDVDAAAARPGGAQETVATAMARLGLEGGLLLHALADRMGMAVTDLSCLLLLVLEGPAGAGRMATRSGLTTGAVTGVIDRLSRAGWVERQTDPADRRRVVVTVLDTRWADLRRALAPLPDAAAVLAPGGAGPGRAATSERPPVPATVLEVLQAAAGAFAAAVEGMRRGEVDDRCGATGAPPRASAVVRLAAWSAATVVLQGAALGPDLARRVDGPVEVRIRAGVVTAGQAHGWMGGVVPAAVPAIVELHGDVGWEVELAGGANRLRVELAGVRLVSVGIRGGANRVELALPAPPGPTPVQITGGANRVRIWRPAGVPVGIRTRGGAYDVRLDGVRVDRGWMGEAGSAGPGPGDAPSYALDVSGGASKLAVETV